MVWKGSLKENELSKIHRLEMAVIRSRNHGLQMKCIISKWTCMCYRVTGQITKFLINPFQYHGLCHSLSPHYLSACSKVLPKPLIIPAAGKDCFLLSHLFCQTQALGIKEVELVRIFQSGLTGAVALQWLKGNFVHSDRGLSPFFSFIVVI